MNELAKTIAVRFKSGESMQDIAASLGITYAEVQTVVRQVMNEIDREHFTRAIRQRYSRNYYDG